MFLTVHQMYLQMFIKNINGNVSASKTSEHYESWSCFHQMVMLLMYDQSTYLTRISTW